MSLSPDQIEIKKDSPASNLFYNPGDLLNMPRYLPTARFRFDIRRALLIARTFKGSILSNYYEGYLPNTPVPDIKRLQDSVARFGNEHPEIRDRVKEVEDSDTLVVHIRAGDKGVITKYFFETVVKLSQPFKHVLLFTGIHNNPNHAPLDRAKKYTCQSVNRILEAVPHAKVCIEEPDVHLYLMSKAKHLLLHLGGFSMIGGLVATGKVYITREIGCLASPLWKEDTKEKNFVYLR